MEPLVYHQRRCSECPQMWCRVYYPRTDTLKGWCATIRATVSGNDLCHLAREPTLFPRELF